MTFSAENPALLRCYAICGSLRRDSVHAALLRALQDNQPEGMQIELCDLIGALPIFNPDHEGDLTPLAVLDLARKISEADILLIASPEYAHGIPGGLKNALDWLVSRPELIDKPVMLVQAYNHRGEYGLAALIEVLKTASLRIMPGDVFSLPLVGKTMKQAEDFLNNKRQRLQMRDALQRLSLWLASAR